MPNDIASVRCEERNEKTMTNVDLHNVDFNSVQVLVYDRVNLFSKRRDLLFLPPEACDSLEDHRVHKVDGGLY